MTAQVIYSQIPSYIPSNGLVGYYPLNGNANDLSGNSLNGTVNGAVLVNDRNGLPNSAYSFTTNQEIVVPNTANQNTFPLSISFWYKLPSYPTGLNGNIITKYTPGSWNGFGIGIHDYTVDGQGIAVAPFYLRSQTNRVLGLYNEPAFNHNNMQLNTWYHIVFTVDSSGGKLYANGVLISTHAWTGSSGASNTTKLLKFGGQWDNWFNGTLDDIGIWNRALTQEEVSTMYQNIIYSDTCNSVSGSLVNGLVAYYPFCGNAKDQSGNGLNGTVNGATLTNDRFGNSNSAYSFTTNQEIVIPNTSSQNTYPFSLSFWYKLPSYPTGQNGNIFTKYTPGTWNGFGVGIHDYTASAQGAQGFSVAPFYLQSQSNRLIGLYNEPAFNHNNMQLNTWYHIIFTVDNSIGKLYVDGQLFSTHNWTGTPGASNNTNLWKIGGQWNNWFNGTLDDIGIWNRALTTNEVTQLYNQNQCITNITVTDTLIINVGQLSFSNPVTYANSITIYPNPASTQVNISFNNITNFAGGNIKIVNSLGQQVATTPITLSGTNTVMALNTWGGTGIYFVQIINAQGQIVDIKKIILQ
jgi:hypothetical protein